MRYTSPPFYRAQMAQQPAANRRKVRRGGEGREAHAANSLPQWESHSIAGTRPPIPKLTSSGVMRSRGFSHVVVFVFLLKKYLAAPHTQTCTHTDTDTDTHHTRTHAEKVGMGWGERVRERETKGGEEEWGKERAHQQITSVV